MVSILTIDQEFGANIEYWIALLRHHSVFGFVRRSQRGYTIVLDRLLRKYPVLHDAVLFHEQAHIRFGTLEPHVVSLRNGFYREWEYERFGRVYTFVHNILEDNRIEYQLVSMYPALVNVMAMLYHAIRIVNQRKRPQTPFETLLSAFYRFTRLGEIDPGIPPEFYDYIWWRVLLARRNEDPVFTVRMASEITSYLYLQYVNNMIKSNGSSTYFELPQFVLQSKVARLLEDSDTSKKHKHKKDVKTNVKVTPWGGYRLARRVGRDLVEVAKEASRILRAHMVAKTIVTGKAGSGAATSSGGFAKASAVAFLDSYLSDRRDEYQKLMQILSEFVYRRSQVPGYEGVVNLKRQQEALVDSYTLNESKNYLKLLKDAIVGDVLVAVDVSGSMDSFISQAISDAVLLTAALYRVGFRVAMCAVADDVVFCKDFDDTMGELILLPTPGNATNMHLLYQNRSKIDFRNEFKAVVFLTDGCWPVFETTWKDVIQIACLYGKSFYITMPAHIKRVNNLEEAVKCIVLAA